MQFAYKDTFIAMKYMTDFTLSSCQHNFINVSWVSTCPPPPTSKPKLKPSFLLSSHPPTTITTHSSVRKISHCFFHKTHQKLLLPTKAVYKQTQSQMKEAIFISQRPHLFIFLSHPIKWYDSPMTSSTNIHSCVKFCQNITKLAESSYCSKFNVVPMMTVANKTNVPAL